MKANELMIGDYVKYQGCIYIVEEISAKVWVHLIHPETKVRVNMTSDYIIDLLEPIPLTPEILESNFEKYNGNYIFSDDFFYFEIHEYNDGMWMLSYEINEMSLPNTQIANICYVHELQHALRLCGLDELADNFKVEE